MKIFAKCFVILALAALVASPVAAQEKDKKKDKKGKLPPQAQQLISAAQKLDLSKEQSEKIQKVQQQFEKKFEAPIQQQQSILTPEQKTQRQEAAKKGKEQGLKGKEFQQFVQQAVKLTPEQQKQETDSKTQILKVQQDFRQEIVQVLTPEQAEKLPTPGKGKGKEKDKGKQNPAQKEKGKDKNKVEAPK